MLEVRSTLSYLMDYAFCFLEGQIFVDVLFPLSGGVLTNDKLPRLFLVRDTIADAQIDGISIMKDALSYGFIFSNFEPRTASPFSEHFSLRTNFCPFLPRKQICRLGEGILALKLNGWAGLSTSFCAFTSIFPLTFLPSTFLFLSISPEIRCTRLGGFNMKSRPA